MASSYNVGVLTTLIQDELTRQGRGAQTRLAEAIPVPVQTVNKWYKGQTTPTPDKWERIEAHFGWDRGEIAARVLPDVGGGQVIDLLASLEAAVKALTERVQELEADEASPRAARRGR